MENYIDYDNKFVVIGDKKYTIDDIKKIQKDSVDFDGVICNIENLMRFAKVRKLAKEIWEDATIRDPIFGMRKYGFVTVGYSGLMLMTDYNMNKFKDLVELADDFLITSNTISFAVYKIWD